MRIRCVGGGPAGLLFAILARSAGHEATVHEQAQPAESFGWGVVFWDGLLRQLDAHDAEFGRLVREHAYTWTDQLVVVEGREPVRIPSFGYSMRRRLMLELLRARATEVGVQIEAGRVTDVDALARGADLVIACDGVNSTLRRQQSGFDTRVTRLRNKYIWLGSDKEFDSFTFPFVPTRAGWVWAHAYGFDEGASTFVVEMPPETWTGLGFDQMGPEATMAELEQLFAASLEGHRLRPQAGTRDRTPWNEFLVVRNRRWHVGNLALMGDAAHTTHFTIGSGTRLAMEDAMTLATALTAEPTPEAALEAYETTRQRQLRNVQREALRSARWYEHVPRYIGASDVEFARMMDDRRSPVMAHLPVPLYLGLTRTADKVPGVAEPLKRLVSKL
jgi:2-polyprenyl-6-methoxyphenol hydroxylase-like FAD-dependent oxidoreductase